jgi:hypothetical protein
MSILHQQFAPRNSNPHSNPNPNPNPNPTLQPNSYSNAHANVNSNSNSAAAVNVNVNAKPVAPVAAAPQVAAHVVETRPFATDATLQQSLETTASIENELMRLNILKETREREYEKLIPLARTKIAARTRKAEIESELEQVNRDISKMRMKLRQLDALHQ